MSARFTERNIESSIPKAWTDIVGNRKLKEHFQSMVRSMQAPNRGSGVNTLVLGKSRSGKTSTTEFAIKAILCENLDMETLIPCDKCYPCVYHNARYKMTEHEGLLWGRNREVNASFMPIDGNSVTQTALEAAIREMNYGRHWVIQIDEIQGLVRRHLDHTLLKAVEMYPDLTWIVSTATTKNLEPMFRNRFTEVLTELPTIHELATFIGQRCQAVGLSWDDDDTPIWLAERCKRIPGLALKCLAKAKMLGNQLTKQIVDDYPFEQVKL